MSKNQKSTTPLYYFIILCVLLIISGCSKNKPTYQDAYILEDDYQYYLSHGAAENEQGYFFTRFDANTGILVYYLDKESMKATVLCNKPECKHDDENCNAQFSI